MKVVDTNIKLPITEVKLEGNSDEKDEGWRHSELLPKKNVRGLIIGSSNSGKTCSLLSLVYHEKGLSFKNIYLFSKSLCQPKYEELAKVMKSIPEIGFFAFANSSEVPSPDQVQPFSLMIFDDLVCEPTSPIKEFFSMGRHRHCDSFFLNQSYAMIPKDYIRLNSNFLVIFRADEKGRRHIYDDHVSPDMSFEEFSKMCSLAWNDNPFGCLVINKECGLEEGRYRIGFDKYIIP